MTIKNLDKNGNEITYDDLKGQLVKANADLAVLVEELSISTNLFIMMKLYVPKNINNVLEVRVKTNTEALTQINRRVKKEEANRKL